MEQRISAITLGVNNLEKSKDFYVNGLGWKLSTKSQENFAIFQIGGIVFALYPKYELAKDVRLPIIEGFSGITLAYNTRNKQEVDEVLLLAQKAGGKIIKPAKEVFWGGYSGYFTDLDGHPFEVCWNPFWEIDKAGNIIV